MRLNGTRRKSRDTDGNDITGTNGLDEQVEARLRDAADFEPDEEPAYDFIAVALRHRRAPRASFAGLVLTGLAGMSAAVILAIVATLIARGQTDAGAGLIPTPKSYDGTTTARAHITTAEQEDRAELAPPLTARRQGAAAGSRAGTEDGAAANQDQGARMELVRETSGGATAERRGHRSRSGSTGIEDAPEVQWKTESVQRYTTGVLTSGWVLRQDAEHGDVTATPVTLDVPLHSGETPVSSSPEGHGGQPAAPSLTLTSLDGDRP